MTRKTLSQQAADRIYTMIQEGSEFMPGDQLPGENILSEELGISRSTLREAIRILASQGILEVYRGKGTFISPDLKVLGDYGLNQMENIRVQLKDLYETRLIFEPEVSAIACRRATNDEINRILTLGEQVEHIVQVGEDRTKIDQEFHNAIVMASHNAFLQRLIPIINRAVGEAILFGSETETLAENTLRDHALLMEFLKKRDAGGAKQAMYIHLHHAIATLRLNVGEEPIF